MARKIKKEHQNPILSGHISSAKKKIKEKIKKKFPIENKLFLATVPSET